MPAVISMLRGVNLGPHRRIKMDALRDLYISLGLEDPRTYLQSGNVVFKTDEPDLISLVKRIESGIERRFGFSSDVIVRTSSEMRDASPETRSRRGATSILAGSRSHSLRPIPAKRPAIRCSASKRIRKSCTSMAVKSIFISPMAWRAPKFPG